MRKPDKTGVADAWLIEMSNEAQQAHSKEWGYPHTGIKHWFIRGPYHPFWHWWMISVIDLRDHPNTPPANKQYPEAEYEFSIYSLKDEVNIEAADKGDLANRGYTLLSPPDVIFQFHGVTDKQASDICDLAVDLIVRGQSCDSDFRQQWKSMLANTVTHYTLGIHE